MGVCYRPPSQANFLELFEKSLSQLRSDCEIYILEYFNIDFHQSHSLFKAYKQVINLFDLKQMIDQPTRITESTKSTIDHILTNRNENLSQHGTIPIGLSDHFMIFCSRRISNCHFKSHNTTKIRSLKNYSSEIFLDKLSRADWNSCFLSTCVNSAWKSFQNIFSNVLDEVAPVKEIRLKQRTEPWMSSEILELIHSRD